MKNVLIVDDDKSFLEMMKASLDANTYSVSTAENGVEGLEKMVEKKADVILLDVKMPKMNGIEFLKIINEKYGEGKTPVIITSNDSSMEQISEGVMLGIRAYIVKSNESLQGIVTAVDRIFV